MNVPEDMARNIWDALTDANRAYKRAVDLLNNPEGKQAESLEDALNALQAAGYNARRAFRVGAVRD